MTLPRNPSRSTPARGDATPLPSEQAIPVLVAQVYEAAPAAERSRLLEQLLRPLGVLSLFGIADGVFARIRLGGSDGSVWRDPLQLRVEDLQQVSTAQVVSLVDHVQQVSVEAVDALAQLLQASPVLSGSAAAAVLTAVLIQRARKRQALSGAGRPPRRPRAA